MPNRTHWKPLWTLWALALLGLVLLGLAWAARELLGATLAGWLVWAVYATMWALLCVMLAVVVGACVLLAKAVR
jgi:hypothetical protein